jgi:KUP system potassium uptake protein
MTATVDAANPASRQWKLALGATGVVFGDIGTSPLYAFRESFIGHHPLPLDRFHVLGVLSMLIWALLLIVTVKYVFITMRADNRGEGGSFALLALIQRVARSSPALPLVGIAALIATALFYGDAVITPAISILSAVEGLELLGSDLDRWIIPLTLALVVGLFLVQRHGTHLIGRFFGPIMVLWFAAIALLGGWQVVANPDVLAAVNPVYAVQFLLTDPIRAFFTLGTVVLAVTGAEALYADMGHFGRKPIARAWLLLALPALILCYAGQSALVLADPSAIRSPFYLMAPPAMLVPLLLLATAATIIASQSIISGAFSVTQQAVQLGYLPRLRIAHTSDSERGQVYSPTVNAMLFVTVVALVLGFQSSTALAAAFGLAVTATMVLTTLLIGFVIFRIWKWNPLWAVPLYGLLLALDLGLFAASTTKFLDGGWLPAVIAAVLVLVFTTWRKGRTLLQEKLAGAAMPVELFERSTAKVDRVPAVAVYLASNADGIPPALLHNLKCNLVLHERILLLTVRTALTPRVDPAERIKTEPLTDSVMRVIIKYGFAEQPDIPTALTQLDPALPGKAIYFLSRQTLIASSKPGMAIWRERLFAWMARVSEQPMSFFNLPPNRVVELGSQVEI